MCSAISTDSFCLAGPAQGEPSLAALAHELGFADHAHLTRTIRAVTGHTPTSCRRLL